jgi:predicted nucleotidyltransferase
MIGIHERRVEVGVYHQAGQRDSGRRRTRGDDRLGAIRLACTPEAEEPRESDPALPHFGKAVRHGTSRSRITGFGFVLICIRLDAVHRPGFSILSPVAHDQGQEPLTTDQSVAQEKSDPAATGSPRRSAWHDMTMTDDEFIEMVVIGCRSLPNVEAVNLGGSRARGDFRPDSDWDFAVYYRGEIDPKPLEELGWPGRVFRPFEWGQVMYGGAVFDLDKRHFDIHYRNLDVVEHWTDEANEGRFAVHILGFHLAGIPTYMLPGELAGSRTLWGDLPRPNYPDALRKSAPPFWLDRANRELDYARYWATSDNPIGCAGALAKVVLQGAHARLAHRGIWALNEKRMVHWAELTKLDERFSSLGSSERDLNLAIEEVKASIGEIEAEASDQS